MPFQRQRTKQSDTGYSGTGYAQRRRTFFMCGSAYKTGLRVYIDSHFYGIPEDSAERYGFLTKDEDDAFRAEFRRSCFIQQPDETEVASFEQEYRMKLREDHADELKDLKIACWKERVRLQDKAALERVRVKADATKLADMPDVDLPQLWELF